VEFVVIGICRCDVVNIIYYNQERRTTATRRLPRARRLSPIKIVNWQNGGVRWRLSNQPRGDGRRL